MIAKIGDLPIDFDSLGSGECVVLIHAIGLNRGMWQKVADDLKSDYRVLLYDLRGHGGTSATGGSWKLQTFSDDLKGLLNYLELPSCSVVGLSLGGMVAQTFALRNPSMVDKLILSNTTHGQTEASSRVLYDRAREVEEKGMEMIAKATVDRWFTVEFANRCPHVVDRVHSTLLECSPSSFAKATRAIAEMDLWDDLIHIRPPVLVTTGEHDPAMGPPIARQIHQQIGDSTLEIIPDSSHMVPLEQPEAYASVARGFLNH